MRLSCGELFLGGLGVARKHFFLLSPLPPLNSVADSERCASNTFILIRTPTGTLELAEFLCRRRRRIMSFVMTDSGVLTPSILEQNVVSFETDIALLDYICNTIERDAVLVVMNRHQMKNAVKRMLLVYSLLSKLPNPRPTPAILCVMRSGLLLLQRMMPLNEHDNHWQQRLRRSFACRHWFAALRERQGAVWHLHSSSSWADEDRRAVEMDEVENATLLMQLVQQGRVVLPDLVDGSSVDALVHSYRGVEQAYWKLPFERLRHRATHDHMPVPHSTITQDDHNTALRFTIHRGYVYEDRRVVVKLLDSDHLDPETMTYFVQDSVARMKWCHPHIVEYFGAFTEKFLTVEQECKAWESAQHSSHRTYPVVSLPGMSAEESARTVMEKNIPRLSLGLVMEDMLRGTTSSSPTSGPLHGFESLHEVLFVEHRRLTIDACISITLQVADALEYILLDKANLPAEVVRAWISISPSNLFIAKNAGGVAASARFVGSDEPITGEDVLVASTDIQVDEIVFSRESMEASPVPSPTKSALTSAHRTTMSSQASDVNPLSPPPPPCETLAVKGSPFVVKYSPPIYVHDGLCSRWYPHPCAKSPSCYALAQLFLALLTNLPPYRYLRTQHDLLRAIFDDQDTLSDDAMVHVKVNRHTGYSIPAGLPKALKALCQGALMLKDNKSKAMTVAQFRDALMDARDCLGQLVHMPLHTTGVESRPTSYPSEMDDHAHRKDTIQSWGDYGDVE